jgi:hypothetical protein
MGQHSQLAPPHREQAPRDVRVALVGDGVVLIRRQPDALQDAEAAQDVPEVRRDLEDVPVLVLDPFQVARQLRHLGVAVQVVSRLKKQIV